MQLNGVYEGSCGAPAGGYTALLGLEIVGVSPAATVREEQATLSGLVVKEGGGGREGADYLVKIEPGHVSWADALVLDKAALIWEGA